MKSALLLLFFIAKIFAIVFATALFIFFLKKSHKFFILTEDQLNIKIKLFVDVGCLLLCPYSNHRKQWRRAQELWKAGLRAALGYSKESENTHMLKELATLNP
jgi:hypothetical protein